MKLLNDSGMKFVIGTTQVGKTVFCRQLYYELDGAINIWLNSQGSDRIPNIGGRRVRSIRGLESALSRTETRINYLAKDREQEIVELQKWMFKKAEKSNRSLKFNLFVDECQEVMPQTNKKDVPPRDACRKICKRGEKRGISLWAITQLVQDIDKSCLKQRRALLVFEGLTPEQKRYLRDFGVDVSEVNRLPQYSCIVYDRSGEVLAKGLKADSKYA